MDPLLPERLRGYDYGDVWETHKSPEVRMACLTSIVEVYAASGAGHPYRTIQQLLKSSSPEFELGSRENRRRLVSALVQLKDMKFWYVLFREDAYVKGVSNFLWQ
jgi:hypothetical protein